MSETADNTPPPPVKSDFLALARYLRREHDRDPVAFPDVAQRAGVKKRKAYYLLEIEEAFRDLPVEDERLRNIGWTKLLHLSSVITRENCDEMITAAETRPVQAIKDIAEGRTPDDKRGMLFFLTPEESKIVTDALLAHGAEKTNYGLQGKEAALIRALQKGTSG